MSANILNDTNRLAETEIAAMNKPQMKLTTSVESNPVDGHPDYCVKVF